MIRGPWELYSKESIYKKYVTTQVVRFKPALPALARLPWNKLFSL